MNAKILGLVGFTLLAVTTAANAALVKASTANYVTFRDCVGPPDARCGWLSDIRQSEYGGRPGALISGAQISDPDYGLVASSALLWSGSGLPLLRGRSSSEAGKRVNATSFGLQRYTYTGSQATTRFFGGRLDYRQLITDPNNEWYGDAKSGVNAGIVVFTSSDAFVDAGSTAESNYNNILAFATGAAAGYTLIGEDWFVDPYNAASGRAFLDVRVNLNPGDAFWVWAFLQTPAADGSWVDAFETFVTSWDNSDDLIPAEVYVPEPGTLALLGLGLAGLSLSRRRKMN